MDNKAESLYNFGLKGFSGNSRQRRRACRAYTRAGFRLKPYHGYSGTFRLLGDRRARLPVLI